LSERKDATLPLRIIFVVGNEHADAPHAVALLRARHNRPCCRAPEPRDEFPSPHVISRADRGGAYRGTGCKGTGFVEACRWLGIE
jgi:hypothetical protein